MLDDVITSIDDFLNSFTETIISGIAARILLFLYAYLIYESDYFTSYGIYSIALFILFSVLMGYSLFRYIPEAIRNIRRTRRLERRIDRLERCRNYSDIDNYFD